jgi:hypothetical protein
VSRSTIARRSRAKGQEYERRICGMLESALRGTTWKRRIQTRGARVDGSDVEGLDQHGRPIPLWLECHNGQQKAEVKLTQAVSEAPAGWHPIAIVHRPGTHYENDTAHLLMGDLMELSGIYSDGCLDEDGYNMAVSVGLWSLLHLLECWRKARHGVLT